MLQLVKTSTTDAALIVNGHVVQSVDENCPEDGTCANLETLAENLAAALDFPLEIRSIEPANLPEGWTWDDVILMMECVNAISLCAEHGVRLVQAQEPEIYGMWDWIDDNNKVCECSFDSEQEAAEDAVKALRSVWNSVS